LKKFWSKVIFGLLIRIVIIVNIAVIWHAFDNNFDVSKALGAIIPLMVILTGVAVVMNYVLMKQWAKKYEVEVEDIVFVLYEKGWKRDRIIFDPNFANDLKDALHERDEERKKKLLEKHSLTK
jgi:hypothetical protein